MATSQYISLKDAALLSNRSQQTIRRLIKGNKVRYRKYKTPQGFTYLVERTSLLDHFESEEVMEENAPEEEMGELVEDFEPIRNGYPVAPPASAAYAPPSPAPTHTPTHRPVEPPPAPPAQQAIMGELIRQHREDKNRLFELLETFQKRILTLEEQIRLLEAPKAKKHWYQFWGR